MLWLQNTETDNEKSGARCVIPRKESCSICLNCSDNYPNRRRILVSLNDNFHSVCTSLQFSNIE
jgi:hypothetical protein